MDNAEKPTPIYRTFIDTFISEFCGIPGIELKIVSPTCFRLFDLSSITKNADGSFKEGRCGCSVISVVRRTEFSGKRKWAFEYYSKANEIFYSVDEDEHNTKETYEKNEILIGMLKEYFNLSIGLYGDPKCQSSFEYFNPTTPYINLGVILGVLLCGERRIITDCHYHSKRGLVIFNNTLVANDIITDLENLKKDNSELREELDTTKKLIYDHLEYKEDTKTYVPKTKEQPNPTPKSTVVSTENGGVSLNYGSMLVSKLPGVDIVAQNKISEQIVDTPKLNTFSKVANFNPNSEER